MNEATRHQIVQRHQEGASIRIIAKELGISRGAVGRVLAQVEAQRHGPAAPASKPRRRGSIIDAYEPILKELLARYPNLTGERHPAGTASPRIWRPVHHRARAHQATQAASRALARAAL